MARSASICSDSVTGIPVTPQASHNETGPGTAGAFYCPLRLSTKRLADPFHALGPGVATFAALARVDAAGVVDHAADEAG